MKTTYVFCGKEYDFKEAVNLIASGKWDAGVKNIMKTTGAGNDDARKIGIKIKDEIAEYRENRARHLSQAKDSIITTSGYNFEGYDIRKYHGVFCAECVIGTGFLTELVGSIDDSLGAESDLFSRKIETARNAAYDRLLEKVALAGANAIIGLDYEYFTVSRNMICVCAKATAVTTEKQV